MEKIKLVFVSSKPLQQSPMFAGKVTAYPSEAPHHIDIDALNMERPARNNHFSLLGPFVSYDKNRVLFNN